MRNTWCIYPDTTRTSIQCSGKYNYSAEEWISIAKKIHGDKYDYSKSEYKKAHEKVIIICKIHGKFEQSPIVHLRPIGCNKCGNINSAKNKHFQKKNLLKNQKKNVMIYMIIQK